MDGIRVFEHVRFGHIRVEMVNGEPWFVAKDIARALGYGHTPHMTRRLDDDEKGVRSVDTPGGKQPLTVINEPGLYAAVLGSKISEAKAFQRWVTHEVLPSIRRTGGYMAARSDETPEEVMARALRIADAGSASASQPWPRRTTRCARRRSSPTRWPRRTARASWASSRR